MKKAIKGLAAVAGLTLALYGGGMSVAMAAGPQINGATGKLTFQILPDGSLSTPSGSIGLGSGLPAPTPPGVATQGSGQNGINPYNQSPLTNSNGSSGGASTTNSFATPASSTSPSCAANDITCQVNTGTTGDYPASDPWAGMRTDQSGTQNSTSGTGDNTVGNPLSGTASPDVAGALAAGDAAAQAMSNQNGASVAPIDTSEQSIFTNYLNTTQNTQALSPNAQTEQQIETLDARIATDQTTLAGLSSADPNFSQNFQTAYWDMTAAQAEKNALTSPAQSDTTDQSGSDGPDTTNSINGMSAPSQEGSSNDTVTDPTGSIAPPETNPATPNESNDSPATGSTGSDGSDTSNGSGAGSVSAGPGVDMPVSHDENDASEVPSTVPAAPVDNGDTSNGSGTGSVSAGPGVDMPVSHDENDASEVPSTVPAAPVDNGSDVTNSTSGASGSLTTSPDNASEVPSVPGDTGSSSFSDTIYSSTTTSDGQDVTPTPLTAADAEIQTYQDQLQQVTQLRDQSDPGSADYQKYDSEVNSMAALVDQLASQQSGYSPSGNGTTDGSDVPAQDTLSQDDSSSTDYTSQQYQDELQQYQELQQEYEDMGYVYDPSTDSYTYDNTYDNSSNNSDDYYGDNSTNYYDGGDDY